MHISSLNIGYFPHCCCRWLRRNALWDTQLSTPVWCIRPFDSCRLWSTSCLTVPTTGCCLLYSCTFWPVFSLEICSEVPVVSAAALAICSGATLYKNPSGQEGRRSAGASSRPKTRLGVRQNRVQRVCNTPLLLLVCSREGMEERLLGSGPPPALLHTLFTHNLLYLCTHHRKESLHTSRQI